MIVVSWMQLGNQDFVFYRWKCYIGYPDARIQY